MAKRIAIILFALILSVTASASQFTTNYNLEIPAIGARDWQPIISADIISIDTVLGIISADSATQDIRIQILSNDAVIQDQKIQILSNDAVTQNINIQILSNDTAEQNIRIGNISNDVANAKSPTYITQTSNTQLTNEQALASLSSGIMRVATTTGVITSLTDILPVVNGGTGLAIGYTVVSNDIADLKLVTNRLIQVVNTLSTDASSGTTTIPQDNTKPQNTEGTEVMKLTITPTSATNKLFIQSKISITSATGKVVMAALFQDTTADALSTAAVSSSNNNGAETLIISYFMTAPVSAATFKVRVGTNDGTSWTMNSNTDTGALFNGTYTSSLTIMEIVP